MASIVEMRSEHANSEICHNSTPPEYVNSGETVAADVTIKNVSPVSWPSKPNSKNLHAVNLAYHWLDKKGRMVVFDGERTPLPYDLKPGESVTLKAAIHAPEQAGAYILEITLVQEGVAWFPENGGAKLSLPVDVARAVATDAPVSNAAAVKKRAAEKRPAPSALAAKADKPKGERGRHNGPWWFKSVPTRIRNAPSNRPKICGSRVTMPISSPA